jgi:hypothetical protein
MAKNFKWHLQRINKHFVKGKQTISVLFKLQKRNDYDKMQTDINNLKKRVSELEYKQATKNQR